MSSGNIQLRVAYDWLTGSSKRRCEQEQPPTMRPRRVPGASDARRRVGWRGGESHLGSGAGTQLEHQPVAANVGLMPRQQETLVAPARRKKCSHRLSRGNLSELHATTDTSKQFP